MKARLKGGNRGYCGVSKGDRADRHREVRKGQEETEIITEDGEIKEEAGDVWVVR